MLVWIGLQNLKPKRRLRWLALVGLLAVLAIGFLILLRPVLPWTVESRMERVFVHGSLLDKRLGYLHSGERVSIQAGELVLAGELYEPPDVSPPHPAILLLHGSTRWGRRLALYRLLAAELARAGYLVLAPDLRGFGDSQTPADTSSVDAWDSTKDISASLGFLESLSEVDGERLFVLGHSLGGTWAIRASEKERRVRRLVVIGPGKRIRVSTARSLAEFRERFWRVRNLEQAIDPSTFEQLHEATFLAAALDHFKGEGHRPILLIDGELESKASRTYLEEQFEQMTQPKKFLRLEDSAHYLNVVGFEELGWLPGVGNLVVYDRRTMETALAAIDSYLGD